MTTLFGISNSPCPNPITRRLPPTKIPEMKAQKITGNKGMENTQRGVGSSKSRLKLVIHRLLVIENSRGRKLIKMKHRIPIMCRVIAVSKTIH